MLNELKNYLTNIQNMSQNDTEHAHRLALQTLINATKSAVLSKQSAAQITITHEPTRDKTHGGSPDFAIYKDGLVLGYIENKRVNADFDKKQTQAQLEKYAKLCDNIILTDYLRFLLFRKNENNKLEKIIEIKLCDLADLSNIAKSLSQKDDLNISLFSEMSFNLRAKAAELIELFQIFFTQNPKDINKINEFAQALATRTRLVCDFLKNTKDEKIFNFYRLFTKTIDNSISYEDFCDNYAQTLTYSLFLARYTNNNIKITLFDAQTYIPKAFPLIKKLSDFLNRLDNLDELQWLLNEIIAIINHIDIAAFTKQINDGLQKDLLGYLPKDPFMHFYEPFLAKYDQYKRESRGVYYTPQPVVDFIIEAVDSSLKSDFNFKDGLKAAKNSNQITLLDFAAGTGTFLSAAFDKVLNGENIKSANFDNEVLSVIKNFKGFELLVAPYAIAHLKILSMLHQNYNHELKTRLNIYLTNTLKEIIKEEVLSEEFGEELSIEAKSAQDIKNQPILIITGNPPYSGASANKGVFENEVKISYGIEPGEKILGHDGKSDQSESFLKLLQTPAKDLGVQKADLADYKTQFKKKKLNEKNPKWLLDDYVKFINFAERKIAKNPSGGIIAIISNHGFLDNPTFRGMRYHLMQTFDKIFLLDLHGNDRKKEKAENGEKDENVFNIMQGVAISVFIKRPNSVATTTCEIYHADIFGKRKDKYNFLKDNDLKSVQWQKLNPQMPLCLFTPQDDELKKQYDKGVSVTQMFEVFSSGICSQRDSVTIHKTKESVKALINDFKTLSQNEIIKKYKIEKDGRDWQIEKAINSVKKENGVIAQINYKPFDTNYTYYNGESRAFIAYPRAEVMKHFLNGENIGLVAYRKCDNNVLDNILISDKIIDLHFTGTGSSVFPLYLYNENGEKSLNLKAEFLDFLAKKYEKELSGEQILGYIYAILFHKTYRQKYISFLKVDFPKILFVDSLNDFLKLSQIGQKLIDIHLLKADLSEYKNIGEAVYKDAKNKNQMILAKPIYNAKDKTLFINESLHFTNVKSEILEYKIGGYEVVYKYLKSHKNEIADFNHISKIIKTLAATIDIENRLLNIDL